MTTKYFKEAAKKEIKELIFNHKFKDSEIKSERDTYTMMIEVYENIELGVLKDETSFFKEAAKKEIEELIFNHKFKDSEIKSERDTYTMMIEVYENSFKK